MKTAPLIDTAPYSVYCGGVLKRRSSIQTARVEARAIVRDWGELGYRREAKIYYRDGSLLETIGYSDLYPPA